VTPYAKLVASVLILMASGYAANAATPTPANPPGITQAPWTSTRSGISKSQCKPGEFVVGIEVEATPQGFTVPRHLPTLRHLTYPTNCAMTVSCHFEIVTSHSLAASSASHAVIGKPTIYRRTGHQSRAALIAFTLLLAASAS